MTRRNPSLQVTERDVRAFLIAEAVRFIDRAVSAPGVRKISIVGSLTAWKRMPPTHTWKV